LKNIYYYFQYLNDINISIKIIYFGYLLVIQSIENMFIKSTHHQFMSIKVKKIDISTKYVYTIDILLKPVDKIEKHKHIGYNRIAIRERYELES
jgi:hypothetical protein